MHTSLIPVFQILQNRIQTSPESSFTYTFKMYVKLLSGQLSACILLCLFFEHIVHSSLL